MGWRDLSEDAQHWTFWITAVVAVIGAIAAGLYWNWWAAAWHADPPVRAALVLAAVTCTFALVYVFAFIGHRYFGMPYPFYPIARSTPPPPAPPVDLVEEGQQKARRLQIRRHVQQLIERRLSPSHEALDKALRASIGPSMGDLTVVTVLVRAYDFLLSGAQNQLGELNVAANRSLQDAPEDGKLTPEQLIDLLVKALSHHFQLCRLFDHMRVLPTVLLRKSPEIAAWKEAVERLREEIRQSLHIEGFYSLNHVGMNLASEPIPPTAPRIVPSRYGHETATPMKSFDQGVFIENHGGPARDIVMHPIALVRQVVKFTGAELAQLKSGDGEQLRIVEIETAPNTTDTSLYRPFRKWQQEQGDLALETVGRITYRDFDGHSFETFYRIGIDILNEDGSMVVEFLEQRWI